MTPKRLVWQGVDEGPEAAAWFTRYLDLPVRLVRFDPSMCLVSPVLKNKCLEVRAFCDGACQIPGAQRSASLTTAGT